MTGEHIGVSPQDLQEAERVRPKNPKAAAEKMYPITQFDLEGYKQLEEEKRTLYLQAMRVLTSATITEANASWRAKTVAKHLQQSQAYIHDMYHHEDVAAHAQHTKKDIWDHPYDFPTEMLRDEAAFSFAVGKLTGNIGFFNHAVELLDKAHSTATEASAKTLSQFEAVWYGRQYLPDKPSFSALSTSYTLATQAAEANNNWERSATIGSRYAIDALLHGEFNGAWEGLKTFGRAVRHDIHNAVIFPKEVFKSITAPFRQGFWEGSRDGDVDVDYDAMFPLQEV